MKVAVTDSAPFIVTVQPAVPAHAPDQPAKVDPGFGCAVNVTWVPWLNSCEQPEPQSMPAGALVTVPDPEPAGVTPSCQRETPTPTGAVELMRLLLTELPSRFATPMWPPAPLLQLQ